MNEQKQIIVSNDYHNNDQLLKFRVQSRAADSKITDNVRSIEKLGFILEDGDVKQMVSFVFESNVSAQKAEATGDVS